MSMEIEKVFHPTDFTEASHRAFAHALRLAVGLKSGLTVFHTEAHNPSASWEEFPHVRQLLESWGMIPPHSPREAIIDLGIGVEKVSAAHRSARESVLKYLEKYPHDLIVLATHQHTGLYRWLSRSIAEPVARRSGEMALFIPARGPGFVSFQRGEVSLRNILIPVDIAPSPQLAIETAETLVRALGVTDVNYYLLRTRGQGSPGVIERSESGSGRRITLSDDRDPLKAVLHGCDKVAADLVVTCADSSGGVAERITGSLTARIVRLAPCPVFTVPAGLAFEGAIPEILLPGF
jgi:nucleotide-binding universal stress UspA family protein